MKQHPVFLVRARHRGELPETAVEHHHPEHDVTQQPAGLGEVEEAVPAVALDLADVVE